MRRTRERSDTLPADVVSRFIQSHRLPDEFRRHIANHYLPLASWVLERRASSTTMLLGINGAQGTGKSTLAEFLKLVLETQHAWRAAVLSIDDFYLTKAERAALAAQVHPLLKTRGVPGTHDSDMLLKYLERLRTLAEGEECRLPRFDKAQDDRMHKSQWPVIRGPVDLIILEGWCVGSVAQKDSDLAGNINELERDKDPTGDWRAYANDRLSSDYARLFAKLDALVFLHAPSFDAVYRWRLEQERKLAGSAPASATGIMNEAQIAGFVRYYERITRSNLQHLPQTADVVFELDERHNVVGSRYRG